MLLSPGRVPITMTTHDNTLPRDSVSTGTNCSPSRNSFRICDCSRCSSPSSASCQWIPDPKCISTIFRFFSLLKSLQLFFWIAKGIKMVKPFFQYVLNYTVICEILHCIGETAFGVLNGDASSWNTMKYCQDMSRFCLIFLYGNTTCWFPVIGSHSSSRQFQCLKWSWLGREHEQLEAQLSMFVSVCSTACTFNHLNREIRNHWQYSSLGLSLKAFHCTQCLTQPWLSLISRFQFQASWSLGTWNLCSILESWSLSRMKNWGV